MVKTSAGHAWEWTETDELPRAHLRECADDTCAWLIDRTKNHSRRWCDMNTCGSRNKVRDFRERHKRVARKAR